MKKRKGINLKIILSLIALILVMLFTQIPAQGATNCYTDTFPDTDCDGLTDTDETTIPQCLSDQVNPQIACIPSVKDLFVILLPCDNAVNGTCSTGQSLLPTNPLSILSTAASQNLGITVHQINPAQVCCSSIRNVTTTQKAVRILESIASSANLGTSIPGTPNTTSDYAYVYTQTINNTVKSICGTSTCKDADGTTTIANVADKYKRHTIAHEIGHMMTLRAVSSTDIGSHYPTQTNVILDSSVYYVKAKGGYTFYIGSTYYTGTAYTPNDRDGAALR